MFYVHRLVTFEFLIKEPYILTQLFIFTDNLIRRFLSKSLTCCFFKHIFNSLHVCKAVLGVLRLIIIIAVSQLTLSLEKKNRTFIFGNLDI